MKRELILLLLSLCWVSAPETSQAGKPVNWRVFRLADGMPSVVCSSVTIDSQGRVLVSHPDISSVSEYDGYAIHKPASRLSEAPRFYVSPAGQLWALNKKGLNEFRDREWSLHTGREMGLDLPLTNDWMESPVICPVRQGVILLILPDRLIQFTSEPGHTHRIDLVKEAKDTGLGRFKSIVPARNGGFWVSGDGGIARVTGTLRLAELQNGWQDFPAPENWHATDFKAMHQGWNGEITLVARSATNSSACLITSFDGQNWARMKLVKEPIRHAWQGSGQKWWAFTDKALLEYSERQPEPIENRDYPVKRYFDVATDASGTFWLATSDGLLRYSPLIWEPMSDAPTNDSRIRCVAADPEAGVWFLSGKGLHWKTEEQESFFPWPNRPARDLSTAESIFPLKNGIVVIKTDAGSIQFERGSNTYRWIGRSNNDAERWQAIGYAKDNVLAVRNVSQGAGQKGFNSTQTFDGAIFGPVLEFPEIEFDDITGFLITQNGETWVSGKWGTAWWHEKKWRRFSPGQSTGPTGARSFIESPDAGLWCAAPDGVWQFDGKSWHVMRQDSSGVNTLARTRDGTIWAGSNRGLVRLSRGAWIENGIEEGLPALQVTGLCEDKSEHLWAATVNGICVFRPKADPDPPRTSIQWTAQNEAGVYEGGGLTIPFQGDDKWKFTIQSRLLYSFHLDGRAWSPFTGANRAPLAELSAGKHYFQVRSMDRNGNIDPMPASLEFNVLVPWYRESRLVLISSASAAVALFFAALALNRHHRLRRSYAEVEKKVAQRTLELEKAHRELLQSQKMTALGTLAAGIAHDFNNILSIIKGSAQIIEENLDDSRKVETRLDRIKTVVEQGAAIVKAMLGFSRESGQESEPCDINEAVNDTIRLLGDRFVREVEIHFAPDIDLPAAPCSKDLVQQILLNFVFNAVEAASADKSIRILTHKCSAMPEGTVLLPGPAKIYDCISVRDSGAGIAPEVLPRIFEPFFTTKAFSSRRGTGLGLSMVYEFAKKLNAGLAVQSVVGSGSTFTLILPVIESPAQPHIPSARGQQKSISGQPVVPS